MKKKNRKMSQSPKHVSRNDGETMVRVRVPDINMGPDGVYRNRGEYGAIES